jgi:hypothetical protein
MTATDSMAGSGHSWWVWIIAVAGGAALTLVALLLFYLSGGLARVAPPVVLTGAHLQLISGQGAPTPDGLEIHQSGPQGLVVVQGSARGLQAMLYRRLFWQVDGLEATASVRLIWATLDDPGTTRERELPPAGSAGGELDLSAEPGWQGRIIAIGLVVRGPLARPLRVRRLELRPTPLTAGELLDRMATDWVTFEGWSQRSINYTASAPLGSLFPPVLWVALWIGFSGLLYALYQPPRRMPGALTPYAALFLMGWLALDVRWQWDLGQRLARTAETFAGKDETGRRRAALDGDLYQFILDVRQKLPQQPARILIVSVDPAGFWAGRARYHLLPHNGYAGFARLPGATQARPGDYVLILAPLSGIHYDHERRILESEGARLPVTIVHSAAEGLLFQVRGD